MGTLELNAKGVLDTINNVNSALKNLGKGVDLDITSIMNKKVAASLAKLQSQIDSINKQNRSATKANNDDLKRGIQLQTEMVKLNQQGLTAGHNTATVIRQQINARQEEYKQLDNNIKLQVQGTEKVQRAYENYSRSRAKAEDNFNKTQYQEYEKIAKRLTDMAGRFALNTLKTQWKEALNYTTQYYDALNEIRVVTMKSEEDAAKMGQNFRQLAKEMKVSSTEIASAAVTFYRQGLGDQDVQKRLEWVTKYAKIANIDFENAAQIVTSATNSMAEDIQGDIQRVVDVFLYLGDSAATSGEEIGLAMQKASASATEFGLSFEWLGAYIAAVSEQTRQAPQAIGNAFNTMLARLHTIRATGYNSEDETKINDVAKALKTIDVELMDQQDNWRDMSDIFTDVSEKWATMTDKQKSYLATTMAGVRQQNVFFALMNDLGKGIENGSRAWELYTGALNAAGTATEKYSIWEDSVAAAQGNMKASLEEMYAATMDSAPIKTFYNLIAGLADGLSNLGGLFPVVAGAIIGTFIPAMISAGSVIGGITNGLKVMGAAFTSNPLLGAALGIGAAFVVGGLLGNAFSTQSRQEKYEAASKQMDEIQQKIDNLKKLQGDFNKSFASVGEGADQSASDLANYNAALDRVAQVSPRAQHAIQDFNDGLIDHATTIGIVNEELEKMVELETSQKMIAAGEKLANMTRSSDLKEIPATGKDILAYLGFDLSSFDINNAEDNMALFEKLLAARKDYMEQIVQQGQAIETTGNFVEGPDASLAAIYRIMVQAGQNIMNLDLSSQDSLQKNSG